MITPGLARQWTYILERNSPDGWMAVGGMVLNESHIGRRQTVDLSLLAFLSGLRMDALKHELAYFEKSRVLTPKPWDHPSPWASYAFEKACSRLKNPHTFTIEEGHPLYGQVKRAVGWGKTYHQTLGLPLVFLNNAPYPSSKTSISSLLSRPGHQKMLEMTTYQTLQEPRLLVLEENRSPDR